MVSIVKSRPKIWRFVLLVILAFEASSLVAYSHSKAEDHHKDVYSVFPFEPSSASNKKIKDWVELISKWQIDEYWGEPCPEFGGDNCYTYLMNHFKFKVSSGGHRILFHWPYNARPWSSALASYIERQKYSWANKPDSLALFQNALTKEQARRNKVVNDRTSSVFQFAKGGVEGGWANAFAAIVYDVHLLGDWVPEDNKSFDGVTPPREIILDLINSIQKIDRRTSDYIVRRLRFISNNTVIDNGILAKQTLTLLQEELPIFIIESNGGTIRSRLEKLGYVFKYRNRAEALKYNKTHPEIFIYI